MIHAISLATKGIIGPCFSYTTEIVVSGGGGGVIIREECIKPKIKVLSFEMSRSKKSKLVITSIKYT